VNRRYFLRNGALTVAGTSVLPNFLLRAALAETAAVAPKGNRMVVIFQRGAADGLNVVVPYREPNYYAMRPTIGIPQDKVLDLDGFFGLHPSLASFVDLYKQGHLAIVHASGSTNDTRSHFDAQDFMENGTPGESLTLDGWMNRALQEEDKRALRKQTPFRAVAIGSQLPRILTGPIPALAIADLNSFSIAGKGATPSPTSNTLESIYAASGDHILHAAGEETFDAVRMVRAANSAPYTPANSATYPNTDFGRSMKQVAQLLKSNLGVETAFTDVGGWDTHQNQGGASGALANRLTDFSNSIAAFWRDMGDDAERITLVTMSEFGRTAHQNGTGGTDHGHGNVMFLLGGQVKGGKVYGKWPGLANEQLYEQRDLAITTDFRQVLGEVVNKTVGTRNLETVFPGADLNKDSFLKILA